MHAITEVMYCIVRSVSTNKVWNNAEAMRQNFMMSKQFIRSLILSIWFKAHQMLKWGIKTKFRANCQNGLIPATQEESA